jgi:GNAT superfamily N-acetyltransferase
VRLVPSQWRSWVADLAWYVAEVAGERAGIAAGMRSHDGLVERRDLISMWVHPVHRGHGIASALLAALREWAVGDGAQELSLWVTDGNAAAANAYKRAGFVPTGRRQPLPSNHAINEEEWLLTLRS